MTPERIAQIQDALAKITPGPWSYDKDEQEIHSDTMIESGGDPAHVVVEFGHNRENNAAFIAQAPDFVRELLAEVERLQKELKDCLDLLEKMEAFK